MTFELAVNFVFLYEGNYTFDANDPGGETRFGISKRAFPNEDIANLSIDRAKDLYRKYYWDSCSCDVLPVWARLMVFDCSVNQGVARAIIFLQRVCGVKTDGVIGPKTLAAVSAIEPQEFISGYATYRHRAYASNPRWVHFGKGWSDRLLDVTVRSLVMLIPSAQLSVS